MPWRTNAYIDPENSHLDLPGQSPPYRSNTNNLFHYCLNEYVNGTGAGDFPIRLASIPQPVM